MIKKLLKLKNIGNIITGYTFRKSIQSDNKGNLFILQSKNIKNDLTTSDINLTRVSFQTTRTNSFVLNNDVAISSRGSFRSTVIKSNHKILASSSVYILRLTDKKILPEFVSLYLNSNQGQKKLQNITTGATIKSILINDLKNLMIPTPSLPVQKNLIKLYQNKNQQSKLLKEKEIINSSIVEGALQKL